MSIYKFNLEALSKKNKPLADRIAKLKDDYSVKVVPTKDKNYPSCVVKSGADEWLVHSDEDPRGEAKAFVNVVTDFNTPRILVISGLGFGYYLDALFAKYSGTVLKFIIIEPDVQLFKKYMQTMRTMYQNNDGMQKSIFECPIVEFIVGVPPNMIYPSLLDIINSQGLNANIAGMHWVEHPVLIRFSKNYFKPVWNEMRRAYMEVLSLYGNDPQDSWTGIDHMLMNMETIIRNPGIKLTKGAFKGKPAVIVATGPSLNNNIHLLPQIKNKAVFFSADASLNTLFKFNPIIKPDIVTCLERNLSTKNHFEQIGDKSLMKDLWLAACPVVRPEVYQEWPGKNVVIFRDFAHFKWIKVDKGILNTGKSVTNMAFKIAEFMGCDPIILVGQDLAFAPSGETHAEGADHAREGMKKSPLLQMKTKVMGNNGKMLNSLETWVGMLKRFEYDISNYKGTCINATEGGALIPGTVVMPLQEAMDKHMDVEFNVADTMNKLLVMPSEDQIIDDTAVSRDAIKDGMRFVEESTEIVDATIDVLEKAFKKIIKAFDGEEVTRILNYTVQQKVKILNHPMCYFVAMHVLQAHCIKYDNIASQLSVHYDNKDERITAHLLKTFEYFHGLKILFKIIEDGIRKNM